MAAPTEENTCEQYEWVDEMVDDIANCLPHCWHFREDCRHSHFRLYSLLGSVRRLRSRSRDRQRAFQEFDMISIYGCQKKITRWDTKSSFWRSLPRAVPSGPCDPPLSSLCRI